MIMIRIDDGGCRSPQSTMTVTLQSPDHYRDQIAALPVLFCSGRKEAIVPRCRLAMVNLHAFPDCPIQLD